MYKLIASLKHLLSATNQHGIHSPFVYDYITKCIYKKTSIEGSKSDKVLFKSIPYFSIQRIKIISKDSQMESWVQKEFNLKANRKTPFDLIYLDSPRADLSAIHEGEIHNNSVILVKNIHKNRAATGIWKSLAQNKTITVSIDMLHCGLLFFRKEQVKEHFKIRI